MSQNIQLDLFNNDSKVSDPGLDNFEKEMMHFDKLKLEQGFETVWSMESWGHLPGLDFKIFNDKPRQVFYKVIDEMGPDLDSPHTYVTYKATAKDGTLGALWAAADDVYKQAVEGSGDWHYFIEDLVMQEDGTIELHTGS